MIKLADVDGAGVGLSGSLFYRVTKQEAETILDGFRKIGVAGRIVAK